MRNRDSLGFITLPITAYAAIGAAVVFAAMAAAIKMESSRLEAANAQIALYKAEGERAKIEADRINAENKAKKEKSDNENKSAISKLNRTIAGLRERAVTSGGSLSRNPAGSRCPDGQTCFDTAEYQRADGDFVKGARGLADEGSQVEIDLATAREWAQSR